MSYMGREREKMLDGEAPFPLIDLSEDETPAIQTVPLLRPSAAQDAPWPAEFCSVVEDEDATGYKEVA